MNPAVAVCRLGDGQHFHARLPGLAVDDGLVGLEEGAGMVNVCEFDPAVRRRLRSSGENCRSPGRTPRRPPGGKNPPG